MKLAEFATPAVPVGYAQLILDVAATHDVAGDELLAAAEVPPELLDDPNGRLTGWQAGALLVLAMEKSGEPAFGYEIGLHSSLTTHGIMGYGLISSATVRQAIDLSERTCRCGSRWSAWRCRSKARQGYRHRRTAPVGEVRQCLLDLYLVGVARMAPFVNEPVAPRGHGAVVRRPRARLLRRGSGTGCPSTRFDMGANQVRFPASDLDLPLATANRITATMVEEQCRRELEQLGLDNDLVAQVRAALRDARDEFPDLETVAERLHLSGRTFKRKLREHGTSFRELVEATRRAEAMRLLNTTRLSVAQIAARLGYADASSFSRAFHKWTSPRPGRRFRAPRRSRAPRPSRRRPAATRSGCPRTAASTAPPSRTPATGS